MAEGIAFSIGEYLIPKLASIAAGEIGLIYNCRDDLKNLKDTLSFISDVLLDAKELQEKSHLVRNRIKKLEEVLYDADDLLDDVATEDLRRKLDTKGKMARQVCDFFSSSNHLAFRDKMGHAIREIRDRLDLIANDISKFNFISNRVNTRVGGNRESETDSFVFTPDIIGREKEKIEIIEILMRSGSNTVIVPTVIPIVGIGGLGKTAFAKLVFNDERVVKHFEPKIWVCVSQDFEKKMIVRDILRCIIDLNEKIEDGNMDKLQKDLRRKLDGKRYLLVLDDVWNEDSERWIQLERLLMAGANNGSKIVVTTRSKKVASAMGIDSPFFLKGLTDEQSWELFAKLAFREGLEKVHKKRIEIGKELVKRCKCVPLAIKTLGSTMRSKTSDSEWQFIQKNKIWLSSPDNHGILSVLKLSYDQLPNHLKYCFAYCSIFPKDYKLEYEVLIQLWRAQGYLQSSSYGSKTSEYTGDQYIRELLSISFFQEVEIDANGNITSFKMHDLIHDLAKEVAGTNCCSLTKSGTENSNYDEIVRHVSLEYDLTEELPRLLLEAKGTRTVFSTNKYRWKMRLSSQRKIISTCTRLRVLSLNNCSIKKMRSSIGLLKHLRYLDLSGNKEMEGLPNSITKLLNLQTLKLSDCTSMKQLPRGIKKLVNLRDLMIDGCRELTHMPSDLGKLILLQRLPLFVVGKDKWGHPRCGRLRELKCLNDLRGDLRIESLQKAGVDEAASESEETILKEKQHLQSLELQWEHEESANSTADLVLEGLQPHPNLKELFIEGYCGVSFPSWMTKMDNLVKITIHRCMRSQQLQSLNQIPCLKFLSLQGLYALEYIQEEDSDNNHHVIDGQPSSSAVFFPSLQELVLGNLPKLKGWWRRRRTIQNELSSTRIETTEEQEEQEEEEEEEEEYTSSSSLFSQLTVLSIRACPMLVSMPLHPNLEVLVLKSVSEKLVQERLITTTTEEEEEEVFHHHQMSSRISSSSSPLSKLKSLLSVLKSVSEKLVREQLTTTTTEEEEIFHHHQMSSTISSSNSPLSKLKSLSMEYIGDLKALPMECLQNLTSLESLEIYSCAGLLCLTSSSGEGEGFRDLTSLRFLSIDSCEKLKSLSKEIRHFTALEHLKIRSCRELALSDADDGMHWQGLRNLRRLEIEWISNLVNLPMGIQHLTTLQHLSISGCKKFLVVPEWIINLTQLQHLRFSDCPKLALVPQEICRLTSLQVLIIEYCPNLTERCKKETGEDWPKISHIPNLSIDGEMLQGRSPY